MTAKQLTWMRTLDGYETACGASHYTISKQRNNTWLLWKNGKAMPARTLELAKRYAEIHVTGRDPLMFE